METDTIILGDCLEVLRNMPDSSIDLILTDPPYGVSYRSNMGKTKWRRLAGDSSVPVEWLPEAYRVLKDGSAAYICSHWRTFQTLVDAVESVGFTVRNLIVLSKAGHGMGNLKEAYAPKHELMLYAVKGRHYPRWPDGRGTDVWEIPAVRPFGRRHPTEKSESWARRAILNSSDPGDIVLDPFCGCGTVPAACMATDRRFVGIEIDEEYHATACSRVLITNTGAGG